TTSTVGQSGPVYDPFAAQNEELAALKARSAELQASLSKPTTTAATAAATPAAATPAPIDWSHRYSTTAWLAGQPGPTTYWAPADVAQKYEAAANAQSTMYNAALNEQNARYNAAVANIGKAPNIYGRRTA